MRAIVLFSVLLSLILGVPLAKANDLALPSHEVMVSKAVMETLARVDKADALCRSVEPQFITEEWRKVVVTHSRGGKKSSAVRRTEIKILERPVVLCAYNERDSSWHVVEIHIAYPLSECFKRTKTEDREATCGKFPAQIVTKGNYRIAYQSGIGIPRLTFKVWQGDDPLTVYRYRHEWLDADLLARDQARAIENAQPVLVTPFSPELSDPALAAYGLEFLRGAVGVALSELRSLRTMTQSGITNERGGRVLLADVIGWKLPVLIGIIEQMDHDRFITDPLLTTEAVLVEYALNREHAFEWSISSASAIGAFQFTDRGGNGTYSLVVNRCRANLINNFWEGARNLQNAAKAAICLLDIELADAPEAIEALYRRDPRAAGLYPVAAYNAGGGFARRMYVNLNDADVDLSQISTEDLDLPAQAFRVVKHVQNKRGKLKLREVMNEETYMYLRKYFFVWSYLSALPERSDF
jgi:hypothetical protein